MNNLKLTDHDRDVLDSIFDPFQIGQPENSINSYDIDEELPENVKDSNNQGDNNADAIQLEIDAIEETENGNYAEALKLYADALKLSPNRASLWNNRAQTYRLMNDDESAVNDLNKALELSNYTGRTGCRSLCQRGLMFRKNGRLDEARDDFNKAAKLGSKFARTQLVELNPYAALCNQMLKETFDKLKNLE